MNIWLKSAKKLLINLLDNKMKNLIILAIFFLACISTGCASTQPKVVQVPVPMACPKPVIPSPPHDYMADLNQKSTPSDFVKACLATRESYKMGYENCISQLGVYK